MMKHLQRLIPLAILACFSLSTKAQIITREDSLNAGLTPQNSSTVISGYGEAKYQLNMRDNTAKANLTRIVTFFGHKFNKNITFFSEAELENASVEGNNGGEFSMEQAFLKLNVNKDIYFTAGLFIPRIGIINENHLPTTFNGNDRPFVEKWIIPATWRELGIGLYGQSNKISGLNYSIALLNGLNAKGFTTGTGIREGRYAGNYASARNLAVTGSLLYYIGDFRLQTSMYYGGSVGISNKMADSLRLETGTFGTPVILNEVNFQYRKGPLTMKGLAAVVRIPDAGKISAAYTNNVPKQSYGAYFEMGYDVLHLFNQPERKLIFFSRYEIIDLHNQMPTDGIKDEQYRQNFWVTGITYSPIIGVTLKADYRSTITGKQNPALQINPAANSLNPYYTNQAYFNLGLGYSF